MAKAQTAAAKAPAVVAKAPTVMTYSRISSFLTCPMKEYYQYRAGGVGIEQTAPYLPFIEGEFLHYALHHYHKSGRMLRQNLLNRTVKIIDRLKDECNGITPEMDDKLQIALTAMVGACLSYKTHYKGDQTRFKLLFSEEPFQFEIGKFVIQGKIDRLMREIETDKLYQWENKSAGQVSSDNYEALPMSLQDLLYCEGAKSLTGEYPDLIARDYVVKTKLRRKKDRSGGRETLAQYEARVAAQYMDEPEKKFFRPPPMKVQAKTLKSILEQLAIILENFDKGEPFMNFSSCSGMYGKPCSFVRACKAKCQGHKDGWDSAECSGLFRTKEALHPELVIGVDDDDDEKKGKK